MKDEARATNGLNPGDCICKMGFGGRQCDRCAPGFRNFPNCEACPCDRQGSANFAACDDVCICKPNVEGEHCNRCKPGHFNLDENNPDGCTPCFCFGMTTECEGVSYGVEKITDLSGWMLVRRDGHEESAPPQAYPNTISTDSMHFDYWKAPKAYTGNLLTAYGGVLRYFVYFVPGDRGANVPLPEVVMKGNRVSIEYFRHGDIFPRENVSIEIPFYERGSWYRTDTRRPISKEDFMMVLSNVDTLLIRALYHQSQRQVSLSGISLDVSSETAVSTERMTSVEKCKCPNMYMGLSCEQCMPGFRRLNNQLYQGTCVECVCNGHSLKCDPYSGDCLDCQENTAGPRCNFCKDGYYGEPKSGGADGSCKQCGCPLTLENNNFSPTCELSPNTGEEYICTQCPIGYVGNHCEMCADGYFGDPMKSGNYCQPCECSKNIDPAAVGNCDRLTGECLKCIGNTEGWNCEKCKVNHYGNPLQGQCRACNCNQFGSSSTQCENSTGDCPCNEHYVGRQCDRCAEGRGDIENGCPECSCNSTGSISEICDPVSGQCTCKPGVFGKHCDQCNTWYYNFTAQGCTACGCREIGSDSEKGCSKDTGQCICKSHVIGRYHQYQRYFKFHKNTDAFLGHAKGVTKAILTFRVALDAKHASAILR